MTRRIPLRAAAAALALALCTSLHAQAPPRQITIHLDPAHTEIHWTLSDVLHTVHGTFQLKGGIVTLDPANGAAEGELLVDLDTGESGDKTRDRLMKKNVLETATYPQAIYHPEKVTGTLRPGLSQQLTVDGTFTIHGKDHPLRMIVQAQMNSNSQITATTHFEIPYVAWGMKDPSTLFLRVGKQVDVDVTARGSVDGLEKKPAVRPAAPSSGPRPRQLQPTQPRPGRVSAGAPAGLLVIR